MTVFDEGICNDVFECLGDGEEIQKMINEDKKFTNKLKEEFEKYCEQMICISFNSAKYDINLIKSYLVNTSSSTRTRPSLSNAIILIRASARINLSFQTSHNI